MAGTLVLAEREAISTRRQAKKQLSMREETSDRHDVLCAG